MNLRLVLFLLLFAPIVSLVSAQVADEPADDDPLWKDVQAAMNEGRPQTAIEKLEPIIARAIEAKDHPEAIKSIALKLELKGSIRGDEPDLKIRLMRAEIDAAPAEMRPVMEAIQARWMWQFFQENRWMFSQRTAVATGEVSGEEDVDDDDNDMLTWDLPRILGAVDAQFARSLADPAALRAIPVKAYKKLLEVGNMPASYRPTLYDILVHHALEFYSAGEQAASKSADAFELSADSPIFGSVADFLAWNPGPMEDRAPLRVAVGLYQDLLRFHLDDDKPDARLDTDLGRLAFGNAHAVGEEVKPRYRAALKRFDQEHAASPISTVALNELAELAHEENDWVEAHRIASEALARFPKSIGATRCFNLIQQIEAREASITTERVWADPWPTIDVRYRNITKVYFRLVQFDFDEFVGSGRWQPEAMEDNWMKHLIASPAVKAWSADLPATADYQSRVEPVAVPTDLPPGSYFLISSHREDFTEGDNQLGIAEVWVSTLALVTRNRQGAGTIGGIVVDSKSGEPISGATVDAWQMTGQDKLTPVEPVQTDTDGRFEFPGLDRNRMLMLVTHGDQRLSSSNFIHTYRHRDREQVRQQTQFFTDRAIYRPGQTIRYKGICFSVDQDKDVYKTLGKQEVSVLFIDANDKEIERVRHRTNEYGSFSGSVTAPRDRLMGRMMLRVDSGPTGQTMVSVEEYKRPRFRVELPASQVAARLGGEVSLTGVATAYTGAPVDGATVAYRVVREVRFPPWWGWWGWRGMPSMREESQEIARGTATTSADGKFDIRFLAKPDASVSVDSEPTFHFAVYADVTDGTGETRSANRTVNLGYTALSASLSVEKWLTVQKPVEIKVRTTTLDGEGQTAEGTIRVHALKQPDQVIRPSLSGAEMYGRQMHGRQMHGHMGGGRPVPGPTDPGDVNGWELGEVVFESAFKTDGAGNQTIPTTLPAGVYRVILNTRDAFGKEVKAILPLEVLDPAARTFGIKVANRVIAEKESVEPGETFRAVWASGYTAARALVEIEHRGEIVKRFWTPQDQTQVVIEHPVTEEMRGGFTLHVTMVRENRAFLHSQRVDVPWSNKDLEIKWERFVSKLQPGQQETWTAIISGKNAERAAAEMVATLYDASLDAFLEHRWMSGFGVFRQDQSNMAKGFENSSRSLSMFRSNWSVEYRDERWDYTRLNWPPSQIAGRFGLGRPQRMYARGGAMADGIAFGAPMVVVESLLADDSAPAAKSAMRREAAEGEDGQGEGGEPAKQVDLEGVSARRNLQETAFFFPQVVAGADGVIRLQFTMPEALTRWQFFGFAHDSNLRGGLLSDTAVTSKDLMVQPNAPRFLREGDVVEFTVKVSNQSPTRQSGSAGLTFAEARTGDSADERLENGSVQKPFDIPAGQSQTLAWRIRVPDGIDLLTYRAVGSSGRLSDGEEGYLPVLPRRILVTQSLPLPIRGKQTRTFDFARLAQSADSDTLTHQSLTVQMASNPSWYAVMSLPYLMEFPHQCSEQIFNRLYANSLARHIATSDPKIERVFEQWRGTDALDSPLAKNADLRAVLLDETPWFRQAESESQSRRNVGILFDQNRLADETALALNQLAQQQLEDGRWPWFPGGPANDFITLYITTGFGRLRHLSVNVDPAPAVRALPRLDVWMAEMHKQAIRRDKGKGKAKDKDDTNHLTPTISLYLYGRSFFLKDHPVAAEHSAALAFWLDQAKRHWLKLGGLQSQAHLAIALRRFGDAETAGKIMVSIKERSVTNEEMGMHWPNRQSSPWWYEAPIETQATLIEAFDEVAGDAVAVEDAKVWLLKQKQTQNWKSTKATADAIYALLLRGTDNLASTKLVEVTLGDSPIRPAKVEAGTGFFEHRRVGSEVSADQSRITVKKTDDGVAWGSVHWQYFEDIDKVTASGDNPLSLTKRLFVKRNTDTGPQLQPVDGSLRVGEELVVRLVLRTDRDLEFVHLRDHRGSGTEPTNVLSGYRFRDGLGYYESTRDTASHFFIDFMRQGTYVFEYSTRVQLRGEYQTGMATIQCMYAPEFGGHSESIGLTVGGDQ